MASDFLGQYQHNLDSKGRLTLPSKFRPDLERGMVVTRGLDGCLFVYPLSEWEDISAKITKMSVGDPRARQVARFFFSGASDCTPDKQGRILIPSFLRDHAKLDTEVLVIGMGNRIEIWNSQTWDNTINIAESDIEDVMAELAEFL